jgi:hypothetical protein
MQENEHGVGNIGDNGSHNNHGINSGGGNIENHVN